MMKKIILFALLPFLLNAQPPGLVNCGVSCYLNSTLQALYAIQPLVDIIAWRFAEYPKEPLAHGFSKVVTAMRQGNPTVLEKILKDYYFSEVAPTLLILAGAGQQDATEFLLPLLDELTSSLDTELNTAISKLFTFKERQQITCPANSPRPTITPQTILNVSINTDGTNSLRKSLLQHFIPEFIDHKHDDKEYEEQQCTKSSVMATTPAFLIIALKRFQFNPQTNQSEKITREIAIPLEFDLRTMITTFKNSQPYELLSAICHQGDATGGHYWAYTKFNTQWYECNDDVITPKTPAEVEASIKTAGYVFIYENSFEVNKLRAKIETLKEKSEAAAAKLNNIIPLPEGWLDFGKRQVSNIAYILPGTKSNRQMMGEFIQQLGVFNQGLFNLKDWWKNIIYQLIGKFQPNNKKSNQP